MPNLRGGKAYKKGKKAANSTTEEERAGAFTGRSTGEDYARVVRLLGNRRVLCFCNDGKERICKIRGSLCHRSKRQIISIGDIVLISLRVLTETDVLSSDDDTSAPIQTDASTKKEIGDIMHKYAHSHWRYIKQESGIHKFLFVEGGDAAAIIEDMFEEDHAEDAGTSETPEEDVNIDTI